jgi:hypothetical protein
MTTTLAGISGSVVCSLTNPKKKTNRIIRYDILGRGTFAACPQRIRQPCSFTTSASLIQKRSRTTQLRLALSRSSCLPMLPASVKSEASSW